MADGQLNPEFLEIFKRIVLEMSSAPAIGEHDVDGDFRRLGLDPDKISDVIVPKSLENIANVIAVLNSEDPAHRLGGMRSILYMMTAQWLEGFISGTKYLERKLEWQTPPAR